MFSGGKALKREEAAILILPRRQTRLQHELQWPSSTGGTAGCEGRGWSFLLPGVVQADSGAEL